MSQRSHHSENPTGLHVACIMDGNGRWATTQGQPRLAGHRAGVETVSRIVEAAPGFGIGTLTLYAFSSDNWHRPRREVVALFDLLDRYIRKETERCVRDSVRVTFIGRRDRMSPSIVRAMERMEEATREGRTLHLRIAVDYSARDAILRAAAQIPHGTRMDRDEFFELLCATDGAGVRVPEVDLLIRTGGEQRLSDFMLWESAYAELHFTPRLWPDFGTADLEGAISDFQRRERRFGRLPDAAVG